MGWMRDNRDALVITVIGGLLVTVGGGIVLANVLPGSDDSSAPVVVQAPQSAKPTVITVKVPTPPPAKATKVFAATPPPPRPPPPAAPAPVAAQPVATPTPTPPPSPAPPPPAPTQTAKVVTTAVGTVVPEGTRVKLLDGRLAVAVGKAAGGSVGRVGLQTAGRACAFARVRPGELLGIRVTRRGVVGIKVVAVSAKGATMKAAASRAPRGDKLCLRGA